ncbi:sugar efflux transporter for intercellular exchange-domain-containing protein [Catenaria anguillulae PL171]|uniref:Sugar efflux transporter for intercellular exchange-domain-containing protein n=1 Tax=Catenaria anguillulae PL171 TaxID=765915 RepID=A0A1Y2I013_9FUNG|nr:sugar efflux transporter for intercellular exchange-domain-containing protein [Catenaria anguillulae PL171]
MSGIQCTTETCRVMLNYVVPSLGVVTAIMTAVSPIPAVRRMRISQSLGSVNPVPYAFIYINAQIWILYGIFVRDVFVIAPNLVGVLLGSWFLRSAYGLSSPSQRTLMDVIAITGSAAVFIVSMIAFLWLSTSAGRLALGILSIIILGLFYTSPLSVFAQVIKTKDSSPFDLPLAATCLLNGSLWVIYGVAIADPFIYGPNALGALFGGLQIVFRLVIPARSQHVVGVDEMEEGKPVPTATPAAPSPSPDNVAVTVNLGSSTPAPLLPTSAGNTSN